MTSTNFAYWLQGFFELSGDASNEITEKRKDIIKKHLELVFKYEKTPSKFCNWLKGFLDALGDNNIDYDKKALIRIELNSIFEHEIDLTYGDSKMQEDLLNIHNQKPFYDNDGKTLFKC